MGYDMYTQGARDCADPDHGQHYLQRALGNGDRLARQIVAAGMGTWADDELFARGEEAPWPSAEDHGLVYDDGVEDWVGEMAEEYRAKIDAKLRDRRGAGPGIAVWKLCNTNDGWWVTKEECAEAMAAWEAAGRPEFDRDDVLPFIRAGAAHDGFRVH
jgi:hypothetical protein